MADGLLLFVGTYTQPILFGTGEILTGKGKGIHVLKLDYKTQTVSPVDVVEGIANPSYIAIAKDKLFLYAVNELKKFEGEEAGAVSAFSIRPESGRLTFLNQKSTGGQDPCHLTVDDHGRFLHIANFMTGSVCVYELKSDGSLGNQTDFVQHEGGSIHPARQKGPHAHACILDDSQTTLLVPDLGLDQMLAYAISSKGKLHYEPDASFHCAPGCGPRFGEFHPKLKRFYLINEIASSVSVLAVGRAAGLPVFTLLQTISTIPEPCPNICADLHITPDGKHLFASNRGHDSIAMYGIDQKTGTLTLIDIVPCGGKTPRNFAIDPKGEFLIVGNQDTDNIALFAFDEKGKRLEQVYDLSVPTPVCIRPYC